MIFMTVQSVKAAGCESVKSQLPAAAGSDAQDSKCPVRRARSFQFRERQGADLGRQRCQG